MTTIADLRGARTGFNDVADLIESGTPTVTGAWTFGGGILVDTISEKTSASGVTIDSVLLKDGLVDGIDITTRLKIKSLDVTTDTVARSTTSTSLINISQTDTSVTVGANDYVLINFTGEASHSASSGEIIWQLRRDSTGLLASDARIYSHLASSSGQGHCISAFHVEQPGAGTYTYRVAIRTASGTVYVVPRQLTIVVFSTDA